MFSGLRSDFLTREDRMTEKFISKISNSIVYFTTLLTFILTFNSTTFAQDTDKTAMEIQNTIRLQLTAFNNNDGKKAFSYASPKIRSIFKTPDKFMAMVSAKYPLIFKSGQIIFGSLIKKGDFIGQRVEVSGRNGTTGLAIYKMIKIVPGDWRIDGVLMVKTLGTTA